MLNRFWPDSVFCSTSRGCVDTTVLAVDESFVSPVRGSLTVAVFVTVEPSVAPAFTVWVNVRVWVWPAFSEPGHVIVAPERVQAPAGPTDDTSVGVPTPVIGNVSVTTSGFAVVADGPTMSPGPLFVTAIVQVIVPACDTSGVGLAVLVIARS